MVDGACCMDSGKGFERHSSCLEMDSKRKVTYFATIGFAGYCIDAVLGHEENAECLDDHCNFDYWNTRMGAHRVLPTPFRFPR